MMGATGNREKWTSCGEYWCDECGKQCSEHARWAGEMARCNFHYGIWAEARVAKLEAYTMQLRTQDRRSELPEVYQIVRERLRQDKKWGEQNHDNPKWMMIAGEEFGEACKATNEDEPREVVKTEVVQLATVCVAWLECMRRSAKQEELAGGNAK